MLFRLKEHRYSPYSLPSPPTSASPSPQPAVNTSIQTDDGILSDTSPLRASSSDQPSSQSESVINVTHPLLGATTTLSVTSPLSGPLPPLGVPLPPSRHFLSHLDVGATPLILLQPTSQPWDKRVKGTVHRVAWIWLKVVSLERPPFKREVTESFNKICSFSILLRALQRFFATSHSCCLGT